MEGRAVRTPERAPRAAITEEGHVSGIRRLFPGTCAPLSPPVAAAPAPVGDLADLLRAARLGEFEATFAAEKVAVDDLIDARDAGDLGDLLADCGLKAGERARLKRELAKLRPVL